MTELIGDIIGFGLHQFCSGLDDPNWILALFLSFGDSFYVPITGDHTDDGDHYE